MFRGLVFNSAMLVWAGIPILLAIALFVGGLLYWRNKVKGGKITYSGETFRDPINAALTVSGLFIPLLCGATGYLIEHSVPPRQLVPLLAAIILFGLSVLVGLWNLFSMTSFKSDKDEVVIEQNGVWGFVPQFATQLFVMFGGIIVVLVYFLFFFDLKPAESRTATAPASVMISRPPLRLGISPSAVLRVWGAPAKWTTSPTNEHWVYEAMDSEFDIVIKSNAVWSIQETRK